MKNHVYGLNLIAILSIRIVHRKNKIIVDYLYKLVLLMF